MPLEPLICRSRYENVKKSYKNKRKFGKSEKLTKRQLSFHDNIWTVTNRLHYAASFILILQGGKSREGQNDSYLQYLIKDRRVPDQKRTWYAPLAISRC